MRIDLVVHIVAGSVGIIAGFLALFVVKGGWLHRKSGIVFVYAMVVMGLMGSVMAVVHDKAPAANVPAGLFTAYLAITALTTFRPASAGSRRQDLALLFVVAAVTLTWLTFGVRVLTSPTGKLYGMPPYPFLIFGALGLLATVGDARLIRAGGVHVIRGAPRIARHLWRMSTALLIAAFSFFLGQAKVFPKPYRIYSLLMIPPLIVLVALLYWLWRVRIKQKLRGIVIGDVPEKRRSVPAPDDATAIRAADLAIVKR